MEHIPPQNIEAEEAVLGSILRDNEALHEVIEIISPSDFYRQAHGEIYQVILNLYNNNQPIDLITVTDQLQKENLLDAVGGAANVARLANIVPTSANAEHYAMIINEKYKIRRVIRGAEKIRRVAYSQEFETADVLINIAEAEMFEISSNTTKGGLVAIKDIAMSHIDNIFNRRNLKGVTGLEMGFEMLDALTAGLQDGDLIIVAARPSMGKTAFATQIGKYAAVQNKKSVAVFSLEMPKEQVYERLLVNESMVDGHKIRIGLFEEEEEQRIGRASARLSLADIFIDDTSGITVPEIRTKSRKLKAKKGLDLIIIDYIQLMRCHKKAENRQREITEISVGLKNLAKELKVPVMALSQLSRAVEQRQDKIPTMADLRESGSLEQDADLIMFLYRDEYYLKEKSNRKNRADIIIAKQRNGPVRTIELGFMERFTKFESLKPYTRPEAMGTVVKGGGWPPNEGTRKASQRA